MTNKSMGLALVLGTLIYWPFSGSSDVLLIEQVRQAENMAVPVNGQTKSEVESQFGDPESKGPTVGDPPISEWKYKGWSVYFEYDRVLFTVLHKGETINNINNESEDN